MHVYDADNAVEILQTLRELTPLLWVSDSSPQNDQSLN